MTRELYTTSRLRVLRTCLRKHHWRYRLGIVDAGSDATAFGTAAHAALEAWLLTWRETGATDARITNAMLAVERAPLSPIDRARLQMMVVAYDLRWGAEPWEVLDVEREFRFEFGEYDIGGKIDAIIRDQRDGRVYVVEHKTTGRDASPGSEYWEKLTIDAQLSIYTDGASTLGYDIAGCIYDVLAKPQHEPFLATPPDKRRFTVGKPCKLCKSGAMEVDGRPCSACKATGWKEAPRLDARQRDTDETIDAFALRVGEAIAERPEAFLMRETIVRSADELARMRADLWDWIRIDQHVRTYHALPPRNDDACFKFGQRCPYLAACKGEADISDETLYPRGAAHPELPSAA